MDGQPQDRSLTQIFNVIRELYPGEQLEALDASCVALPSAAEGREALRLFSQIDSPEMRKAVRMLMRLLARTVTPNDAPNGPPDSAANRPA